MCTFLWERCIARRVSSTRPYQLFVHRWLIPAEVIKMMRSFALVALWAVAANAFQFAGKIGSRFSQVCIT
jgi:hypothetical protein